MRFSLRSFFTINAASLTFATILLVVILFHIGVPILDMIELKTYDLRFLSRGRLHPSSAVVLALIDEKSLDKEGRWPWPRSKMAALINILSQDGAKVIGFDIGFLEPDENSLLQFINRFGKEIDALDIRDTRLTDFVNENKENADNDLALAKAIRNSSSKIVLGYFFHMSQAELDYRIDQKQIDRQIERISASKYPLVISHDSRMESFPFPKAYAPESNLEILAEATPFAGFFTLSADYDGVVRWMPIVIQCGQNLYPPLSVSCAWLYLDKPQLMVEVAGYGAKGIKMGGRFIPTDENGQLLIIYPSRTSSTARLPRALSKTESCWWGRRPWGSMTCGALPSVYSTRALRSTRP
jgi:adenylate cyclase